MQRYISVYSGGGGLDLGLTRAGFKPGLMVDHDRSCCDTLRASMPTAAVLCADVHDVLNHETFRTLTDTAPAVLVAGQPPIAGAPAGSAQVDPEDDAPQLLYRFLDVVAQARPTAFVMATLPFVAGRRWALVMSRLRGIARKLGYDTYTPVLDAAEYGVPQHHPRLFFIGMPPGCRPDGVTAWRRGKISAGAALRELQAGRVVRDIPCNAGIELAEHPVVRKSPYEGQLLRGQGRVIDLRKVAPPLPLALGGNKTPIIDLAQLESGGAPWIESYHDYLYRLGGTPGIYDGAVGKMRRLSLRECAALQGFPPGYPFHGNAVTQFHQAGAAIPPALAMAVARAVQDGLA